MRWKKPGDESAFSSGFGGDDVAELLGDDVADDLGCRRGEVTGDNADGVARPC